jgi:hypothetical protein
LAVLLMSEPVHSPPPMMSSVTARLCACHGAPSGQLMSFSHEPAASLPPPLLSISVYKSR